MMIGGCVVSLEDHGYVLSFGIGQDITGFLLKSNSREYLESRNMKQLFIGQVDIVINILTIKASRNNYPIAG